MYSVAGQGQTLSQGQGQSDANYQCGYSVTSPVECQTGPGTNGYNYPVPFSQHQTMVAPNQSQMFYSVQNQQSNQPPAQSGYVYSGQQGTTYQTSTPPSQNSTVAPNVQLNSVAGQPVNMNTINTANTVNQTVAPQQTPGVVQGSGGMGNAIPTQSTQYVSSFQTSHPTMHHTQQFHHPQSFSTPIRPVTPHVVPMQGVPVHGNSASAHSFHSVYRPNMQMPMQIHQQQPQVQQQQALAATTGSKTPQTPTQHVTVSAKGLSFETSPVKVENGSGESSDLMDVQMANTMFRPHAPNPGKLSIS